MTPLLKIEDADFLNDWLDFGFKLKEECFDRLLEDYKSEADPEKKALLRARILADTQAQLEDLAQLLSTYRERTNLVREKKAMPSLLNQLSRHRTQKELANDLITLSEFGDIDKFMDMLGLPRLDQSGGEFWQYKPGNFFKARQELASKLNIVSTYLAKQNALIKRMGNKIRHFGFIRLLPDGDLEVLVDVNPKDDTIDMPEGTQMKRERVPLSGPSVDNDERVFRTTRVLIDIFIKAYLAISELALSRSQHTKTPADGVLS